MDFQLSHFFRTVCEDALLIIDVIRINPSFKPVKESWLECFTEGLGAVIQSEAMELVPSPQNPDISPKDETAPSSINNKILTGILFEFCYSILLQFSLEELSQYPFWAAKVSLCTGPIVEPPLVAWRHIIRDKYSKGGVLGLFEGSAPYLVGAYLHNIAAVELSMRRFFATVLSSMPRSPSMLTKQQQQQQQQQQMSSKLKRSHYSCEDPRRRQETFDNTGLNASTSDSHMFLGTFKNVRGSIISDNGKDNGRDIGRRGKGKSSSTYSNHSTKNKSKNVPSNGAKNVPSNGNNETSNGGKRRGSEGMLANIWGAAEPGTLDPDSEEAGAQFPGKSCSNSSNTLNIGLNIDSEGNTDLDLDPCVSSQSLIGRHKKGVDVSGLGTGSGIGIGIGVRNGVRNGEESLGEGVGVSEEDNIDNDDIGPDCLVDMEGDVMGEDQPLQGADSEATIDSGGSGGSGGEEGLEDPRSSSRLLSSNPSFPTRSISSNRLSPSLSSSSFPSSSSRFSPTSSLNDKKSKVRPTCYFSSPGVLQRIIITALAHPFLVISVKMVTNPDLKAQNWMYSYVHIVTRSGLGGLYSGIRAALGTAFIPFPHSFLFGMAETVVYRCMLDQGIVGEGSSGPGVGLLSAVTSAVVVHKVSSEEGIYGMLRYGLLTAAQVIPGFGAFLLARSALWLVLGNTRARKRQLSRRREILEEYWRSCRGTSHSERIRSTRSVPGQVPAPKSNPSYFSVATPACSPSSSSSSPSASPCLSSATVTGSKARAMTDDATSSKSLAAGSGTGSGMGVQTPVLSPKTPLA